MSQCNIQTLLDDGKCFAAISPFLLRAIAVQLWCDAASAIAFNFDANVSIQSQDDGEWYRLVAQSPEPGAVLLWLGQTPTDPGVNPYLVITNDDDGLKYKVFAIGTPPDVRWEVDTTPTGEAETPTTVIRGPTTYTLSLVNPGPVPILTAV